MKISARFPDFSEDFCKISRCQWRFLQDFQILVHVWHTDSEFQDVIIYCIICRLTQCTSRNLHSSMHYISCMCDTDTMFKQVIARYLHACMHADWPQTILLQAKLYSPSHTLSAMGVASESTYIISMYNSKSLLQRDVFRASYILLQILAFRFLVNCIVFI